MFPGTLVLGLVLALLGIWLSDLDKPEIQVATETRQAIEGVAPSRLTVVDGDTVRLEDETIRLIGFDTPETYQADCESKRARGEAATARLRDLLVAASEAWLRFRANSDRYQRRLAQLTLDGQNVADTMVDEGLARPYNGGSRRSWC
ncbi:thermonuclease family protein [uncultured Roseobacter sp.]|uniref:thermonuclease family protein n=1 Tax=uncultured Roseobacter sp. TaxID=114847 RepID=UPI00345D538B